MPELGMDMYRIYNVIALSYMMKSQSASWSKDCEFQFRAIVANVLPPSIILTLEYFDNDFSVNSEEKCTVSDILPTDGLFSF